jgi:rRNA-processing protein FCF1
MEKIIFDTNFILTAIKQKIDFISDLEGYELLVPKQVLEELKKMTTDKKKKLVERELAGVSLAILDQNKSKFKIIELEKSFVDTGLLRLKPQEKMVIATLDREIKRLLKGKFKFLTITKRKKLEIVG